MFGASFKTQKDMPITEDDGTWKISVPKKVEINVIKEILNKNGLNIVC